MIDFIFTLDYEIYGNGEGALSDLVYEPAVTLQKIFRKWDAKFVVFVEVAELEKIEAWGADPAIALVTRQIRDLHQNGFEIGLHLHPQWCNARYHQGRWTLDSSEYNLCTLSPGRISEIVDHSVDYLQQLVGQASFVPLSFRAGNWLFQPTLHAAAALSQKGLRIDSSVFKGGILRNHNLDYRRALRNGYYWSFGSDVNEPDPAGPWIEVPIYTEMVPSWRMATAKRLGFRRRPSASNGANRSRSTRQKFNRALDLLHFRYPLKLDFCRMTLNELTSMVGRVIQEDRAEPMRYRPLVAIGHTKDLTDPDTVDALLSFLRSSGIAISTFENAYPKLLQGKSPAASLRVAVNEPKVQVQTGNWN